MAEALIGEELEYRPELLEAIAKSMPSEVNLSLRGLLSNTDFRNFFPNAKRVSV